MNRRALLKAGALLAGAAALGVGADAIFLEPHDLEIVRLPMPLEGLPPELAGRTVLQVSDIHVGPRVSSAYLLEAFAAARDLAPDFVAFTGDFVSYRSATELAELARVLRHFPRGRLGTVAALGNHDYGHAWREAHVADEIERVAGDAGIRVLRNQVVTLSGLQLAGLGDYWSPDFGRGAGEQNPGLFTPPRGAGVPPTGDARDAIASINRAAPTVVLAHNPDVQDEPIWEGIRGWVLSGHTHGGQVKPPFLPPPVLPVRNKRYSSGAFEVGAGRTLYINRGLGHLIQVRFNVRPELTLFTLQRA